MSNMKKATSIASIFGKPPEPKGRQKQRGRLRKRKPKRQGSRDQRGKILPERQRNCCWRNQPRRGKEG